MDTEIVVIFNNDDFGIFQQERSQSRWRYESRSGFQTEIETIRHVTCEVKFIV